MSLWKAGLWHLPRLSFEELVEGNMFVGGSVEPALEILPKAGLPPALSPLCFCKLFNYHFEHNILESYFSLLVQELTNGPNCGK